MPVDPKRDPVTGAHMREAQRSLIGMFRSKGFPVAWVNRNAIDLLAQANLEYVEWLERHEPEPNPVGWLVTCAYRRGLNLLSAQGRRPGSTSIDAVFSLADESTPTPEAEAIEDDRQQRLRQAMSHLPQRERKLLSLVYFEGRSVTEAGGHVGWRKSAADRHHKAALDRLRALVDPSLLSPAGLGLAAWVAARESGSAIRRAAERMSPIRAREPVAGVLESTRAGGARLGEATRRLVPLGDPASIAVTGGAARLAGACGAAVIAAACALLVAGGGAQKAPHHDPAVSRPVVPVASEPSRPAPSTNPVPSAPEHSSSKVARRSQTVEGSETRARAPETAARPGTANEDKVVSHQATPADVEEEFGIEGGSSPTPESESAPTPPAEPESPAPPVHTAKPAPPASGSQVESEFGL